MEQKDYRLAAIMFTDIHGFSRMMEKDEAGTLKLLKFHNDLVGGIAREHKGTVIKTIGDALLIDFRNTVEALQAAIEVQEKLYEYNKEHPELPLLIRIGIHLGDIYFFENDALGEGINIASRLQSIATPGCICLSSDVYNMVVNKIDFHAEKLGRVSLKNISKEIHAYEIKTRNVEFNPDPGKPRILKPDPDFEAEAAAAAREGEAQKPRGPEPSARLSTEAPKSPKYEQIRSEIMADMKAAGRRMTEREVWQRYSSLGDDARQVIADLSAKGLLQKSPEGYGQGGAAGSSQAKSNLRSGLDQLESLLPPTLFEKLTKLESKIEESISRAIEKDQFRGAIIHGDRDGQGRTRFEMRFERGNERLDRRAERRSAAAPQRGLNPYEEFQAYKARAIKAGKGALGGFIGHFIPFAAVNAFLLFLNATTGSDHPWFLYPLMGWGIGLVNHFASAKLSADEAHDVERLPDLTREQLRIWKKIVGVKNGIVHHGVSTLSVSAFLVMINVITGGGFFWAGIPMAALFLSFIPNLFGSFAKRRALKKQLLETFGLSSGSWRDLFTMGGKSSGFSAVPPGPCLDAVQEAMEIKQAILSQVKVTGQKGGPVDKDIIPALESYMKQVYLLASRTAEVEQIIETIPMKDLAADKVALAAKRDAAPSEGLKREYQKNIDEIEKHEKSYKDLTEQKEVLYLRLKSSVNNLKQMQINMARVATLPNANEGVTLKELQERTEELSNYLEAVKQEPIDDFEDFDRRLAAAASEKPAVSGADAEMAALPVKPEK